MATRDISIQPSNAHQRLLKVKSLLSMIRQASLYQMEAHPDFFDISEVVEMVETEIGQIAETLEK